MKHARRLKPVHTPGPLLATSQPEESNWWPRPGQHGDEERPPAAARPTHLLETPTCVRGLGVSRVTVSCGEQKEEGWVRVCT